VSSWMWCPGRNPAAGSSSNRHDGVVDR
jgi:hypothetical protein